MSSDKIKKHPSEFQDISSTISPKFEILYREYDNKRCSYRCPQIDKIDGTYHCTLFNQEVDKGDDDITGDYLFLRCSKCYNLTNER